MWDFENKGKQIEKCVIIMNFSLLWKAVTKTSIEAFYLHDIHKDLLHKYCTQVYKILSALLLLLLVIYNKPSHENQKGLCII